VRITKNSLSRKNLDQVKTNYNSLTKTWNCRKWLDHKPAIGHSSISTRI